MRIFSSLALLAGALCLLPPAPALAQERRNPQLREVPDDSTDQADAPASGGERHAPRRDPYDEDEDADRRRPAPRRGPYYASFGVGAGSEAISALGAPAPYTPSRLRPTLNIGLGAGVGQSLRIGFEGFAWFNVTGDGALETVTTAMLGARLYPIPTGGLYVRAGGGFGRYGQDLMDDYCGCSYPLEQEFGLAWAVGAGYEVPVGNGLWLGPSVEMVRMDVTGPGGYRERVLNFGLTLTFDGHD